jgi:hypothetical protein
MTRKNFVISHVSDLKIGDRLLDLHNDVELERVIFSIGISRVELLWKPSRKTSFNEILTFQFDEVERVLLSGFRVTDDSYTGLILSHIGYLPISEIGSVDSFFPEDEFTDDMGILLAFEDGSSISVVCESAQVCIYPVDGGLAQIG